MSVTKRSTIQLYAGMRIVSRLRGSSQTGVASVIWEKECVPQWVRRVQWLADVSACACAHAAQLVKQPDVSNSKNKTRRTSTACAHADGTGGRRRPDYPTKIRVSAALPPVRAQTTYDEQVDDLDRVLRDHELVAGLHAAALGAVHGVRVERALRLQQRRRACERAPALHVAA